MTTIIASWAEEHLEMYLYVSMCGGLQVIPLNNLFIGITKELHKRDFFSCGSLFLFLLLSSFLYKIGGNHLILCIS